MKRILLMFSVSFFLFIQLCAIHPQVRNFTKKQFNAGTQNWDIIQHRNNWMYFANNNGLLEYDGNSWAVYPISNYTNVRSLYYDEQTDRIYAGAFNEFGYYVRNDRGILRYTSLKSLLDPENENFNEIWNIDNIDGTLFFQGGSEVFRYKDGDLKRYDFSNRIDCSAAAHGVYVASVEREGVYMLNGDLFLPFPGGEVLKDKKICSILPFTKNRILFATEFDGLYLFDGEKVSSFQTDLDAFMRKNQVFCAEVGESSLAIGTVRGGLVVKDLNDNSNIYSNIHSGLQNNTVLSMKFDNQDNLWVGLDKGIDYVMINSPVYNLFANNQLYGAGYTSLVDGGWLYLGTNQGLYRMKYPVENSPNMQHVELLPGMQGQVWSLEKIDGTLFCGTNYGAYIVMGNKTSKIGNLTGTWNFIPLKSHPGYILGSSYDGFFLLKKTENAWRFSNYIEKFNESGGRFEEDEAGNIWFSHWMKGIYKLNLNEDLNAFSVELFDTSKGFYSVRNNLIFKIDNEVVFSGDGGFFVYDAQENRVKHFEKVESVFGKAPYGVKLAESPQKNIWALSSTLEFAKLQPDGSYAFDRKTFSTLKSKLIPGFEHFNFIDDSHLIVNTEEGFAWIDMGKANDGKDVFKVSIKKVYLTSEQDSLAGGYITMQNEIPEFAFRNNSLRFEFVAPEFGEDITVTYSCLLENYDSDWSNYSTVNTKEYTQLPSGDYSFRVRAHNGTGAEPVEANYQFAILPPWYLSWIAIITYAALFAGTIFLMLFFIKHHSQKGALEMKKQKEQEMHEQEQRFVEEKKEKEQEITSLKNQKLQYELRHKSRDLASSTMNVIRKNEILLQINNDLDKISDDIKNTREKGDTLKRIVKVQNDIKKNIERDDNWKKFEANFDMVYENYLKRLGEEFPVLTVSDKKLCAYLKMGLSSKDIAPLLNMSFRSVEMSRYRLRKKLNLSREDNLMEFLQSY